MISHRLGTALASSLGLLLMTSTGAISSWSAIRTLIICGVAAAGRGNIDGEPIQGSLAQFVARQASLLRPRRVVLSHHDDWFPGFSAPATIAPIREELARLVPGTVLEELGYLDGHELFGGR
jgi:hypothetical protein